MTGLVRSPGTGGRLLAATAVGCSLMLAGCQSPLAKDVASGADAYKVIPVADTTAARPEYRIGALDTLDITVFQEPELSLKETKVDAGGVVLMPLIGSVTAEGKTSTELADDVAVRLGQRYLQNPKVSVTVRSAVSQRVSVEGSVNEAGVFEIQGRTSLIEALAMAKGTSRTAALSQVVVFRNTKSGRIAAVFDVNKIRKGNAPDPEILGNDIVVVGFSNLKAGWRDFLGAAPVLGVFRPY